MPGRPRCASRCATHPAKLNFAADRLPRTKAGKLDATITFANGERVSTLKLTGRHGYDNKPYIAKVTSPRVMRHHGKFTVTFRLGDSKPVHAASRLTGPAHTTDAAQATQGGGAARGGPPVAAS